MEAEPGAEVYPITVSDLLFRFFHLCPPPCPECEYPESFKRSRTVARIPRKEGNLGVFGGDSGKDAWKLNCIAEIVKFH